MQSKKINKMFLGFRFWILDWFLVKFRKLHPYPVFKNQAEFLMKRVFLLCTMCFVFAICAIAQTTPQPTTQATPPPAQPQPQPTTNPVPNATPPTPVQPQPGNVQTTPARTNPALTTQQNANPTSVQSQSPTPTAAGQSVGNSGGVAPATLPQNPPAIEPTFEAPNRPLPSAERVGVDVSEQVPISLNDAITMALQNNNSIEISQIDVRLAEFDLRAARGAFDPRFTAQSFFERSTVPTASTLGGANGSTRTTSFSGIAGLNGFSPIGGGTYQTNFNSQRQTTNNPFTSLNPQFPSTFTLSYTQPLFRGRRIDNNRRQIQIARKNLSLTDAQFRQQAINVITSVVQSYWELVYALRNLQVQIDAVRQARAQVESNQRQVQEGYLAPIDIVAAATQVTNFEQNVYTAQEQVTRAESNLKTLILPRSGADLWTRAIVPTTPVNVEPPPDTFDVSLAAALANRPELAQLETSREINEINRRYFRDLTRPQIDLVTSFSGAGLAGTAVTNTSNPLTSVFGPLTERINELSALHNLPPLPVSNTNTNTLPGNLVGGFGRSLLNILGFNYPTFRVGLNIDFPIFNRTARANLGRAQAEGTRIEAQRDQQIQQIRFEVQTSLQALRSAQARLASAAASRTSSEQLYESERRRLENGVSTVYLVLQRQQELVAARANELRAQTDLNNAIADFQRATGSTFQAHNVTVSQSDATVKRLQINTPAPSDTDSGGFMESQPRRTPPVSPVIRTSSLTRQP